jgi:hypothetical protein
MANHFKYKIILTFVASIDLEFAFSARRNSWKRLETEMSKLSVKLPESLHEQLRDCANAAGTSVDQLVSSAVAEKVAALLGPDYLEARAKRGSRKKFIAALKKVPDVEPQEFDRLPNRQPRTDDGNQSRRVPNRRK